jgi:Protein of unknown function (DUF2034)
MLRCPQLGCSLLRHVNLTPLRAGLATPTCHHRRQRLLFSTYTSEQTRDGGCNGRVKINIETDLDHTQVAYLDVSKPVLNPTLPSPSCAHHDLSSFVAYARRTGLSTASSTYKGTYYEYLTILTLRRYGFDLVRVGGRGDEGIDLVGTWRVPSLVGAVVAGSEKGGDENASGSHVDGVQTQALRVLIQCKRFGLKSSLGPSVIRELEGAMQGVNVPVGWRGPGVLGILVGPRSATKGVRNAIAGTRRAMSWVMLEAEEFGEEEVDISSERVEEGDLFHAQRYVGKVRQILWNKAASTLGLEGLEVVAKYDGIARGQDGQGEVNKEVVLMWQGKVMSGLD